MGGHWRNAFQYAMRKDTNEAMATIIDRKTRLQRYVLVPQGPDIMSQFAAAVRKCGRTTNVCNVRVSNQARKNVLKLTSESELF